MRKDSLTSGYLQPGYRAEDVKSPVCPPNGDATPAFTISQALLRRAGCESVALCPLLA